MPLFWLSLAFLTGILLAAKFSLPMHAWGLVASGCLLLVIPRVYRSWVHLLPVSITPFNRRLKIPGPSIYPLFLLFMTLGAIRYQHFQPIVNPTFIAYYNDRPGDYILEGVLVSPPDRRDAYANLRVQIDQIRAAGEKTSTPVRGNILATVYADTELGYGDRIRLKGKLETPPENEDFSYRDYLAHQAIYSVSSFPEVSLIGHDQANPLLSALVATRDRLLEVVHTIYPDPEASLVAGIILGEQSGITESVQEAFRKTGTSHVIVISGFNISIIAVLFTLMFSHLLGRYKGALVAAIGIVFYTLLVGANAAVLRAAFLGLLTLPGQLLGRRQYGLNSLAFAAAFLSIFNPTILWDVSFQLSFAATLGIMLYAEPLSRWFTGLISRFIPPEKAEKLVVPMSAYFLLTLAAQLTTLPLIIYYFNRLSLTSLLANPLILPAQPPLMVLGGLSAIAGAVFQPLGQLLAWLCLPFTAYTIHMVEWLATIPHSSIALGQTTLAGILLFYAILFAYTLAWSHLKPLAARLSPAIPLTILGAATFMVWKAAFYAPDGLMHITVLDVGTGEAVLVQSPGGRSILINGGPSTLKLSDALGRRLPPFDRSLDWLVVADIDNEDLSGVPGNLERFPAKNVLWAGNTYATHSSIDVWTSLLKLDMPITRMQVGHSLDLGSGASLQVLSIDARGAVLLLEWENFRMLLPMGMDFDALENLQLNKAMRNVSVVLLAESGYAPLNTPELISFLHPHLAVLSVAPADRDGLPSPETLEALEGFNLLRTDVNGWIQITTDGKQMWVEVERK